MGMAVGFALLAATLCWLLFSWDRRPGRRPPPERRPPLVGTRQPLP